MNAPAWTDLLAVAQEAASRASAHARANEQRRREVAQKFAHDVKLNLDSECQRVAESVIRNAYPHHAVLGEEGSLAGAGEVPEWIIDPIDGTVNFSHGLHYWCSSVAVRIQGRVVAGCVTAPMLGDVFTATADTPALCNGRPIQVSAVKEAGDALVLTGLEKSFKAHEVILALLRDLSQRVQKVRILGAAALDICQVACGRADGFMEQGIYLWDMAAGDLVARQAGARSEVLRDMGPNRMRYLCTNGHFHDELKQLSLAHDVPV